MEFKFEWDPSKAAKNLRKHGVSFHEAMEAFSDPNAIDDFDRAHSTDEEHRLALIGVSAKRLLFVSFTVRDAGGMRIISARKANKAQERFYNHAKD